MGRVPAASESDQRCALLGGLRVIEHSPVLGNTAFSYYEAAHKAHVARMRQRGAAVDKEFWPTPRERARRASRRSMTVTRTTIWTRTSNRAAREAPAVVRCGRVRPQLILLFGGGLSHGIPCRVVEETSRRITTGAATIAIAAGSTAFGGPQCCAPSAGGTGSRKASSMQLMAFSRRCLPHLPGSPT